MTEPAKTEIVVVTSARRFRHIAKELPTRSDSVLEIGCATGRTTRALVETGAQVVSVDVGERPVRRVQEQMADFANVAVARVDGRDTPRLAGLVPDPDLIFLDIGGNAHLDNVTLQVRQCLRTFRPRVLVVRSRELAMFASMVTEVESPDDIPLPRIEIHDKLGHALEALLDLSRSSHVDNRMYAARKLRSLAAAEARERLTQMLDDPDHRVRRVARLASQQQGTNGGG